MAPKTTLDYIRETYVWCASCQQLLKHDRGYCPLFPDVKPPYVTRRMKYPIHTPMGTDTMEDVPGKKWSKCVCLVHTCYDNSRKLAYADFERASVLHYAFQPSGVALCGRVPPWPRAGPVVEDPFKQGTCQQCVSVFLKRAHVYRDFLQAR